MARMLLLGLALVTVCGCALTADDICRNIILPEQTEIQIRDPSQYPAAPLPPNTPPRTVTNPRPETVELQLSLDEALRIALENSEVVRTLAGTNVVSSGQTIYDAAITNATIDQAQATFDPTFNHKSRFNYNDSPTANLDPFDPRRSQIGGTANDEYVNQTGFSQTNLLGGQWQLNWNTDTTRFHTGGLPLNPQTRDSLELDYTQPLLQGAGFQVNAAPIIIARLNTEQSYFQYKDSVQELVRSVIEAYWNLVQARINEWARNIQVQTSKAQYERESARLIVGFGDKATEAQARVSYNQFQANLVAAKADVLTREGALRNILGLPPDDDRQLIPVSAPTDRRLKPKWPELVRLAEQRRPDIVELKIIIEADEQRLIQARNQELPKLDAVTVYRWNGLEGRMPNGQFLSSRPGQFTDWSLGVNFSVPLGLRQGRAQARQQTLIIARDRANLQQGLHAAIHDLAANVRDLDSAYDQYLAFKETRTAAFDNLRVQIEQFGAGRTIYLNVLQALNDWGNAVSSEAQQLLSYNVSLATLERRTGTILETHGLVFAEEQFGAVGPLGCLCDDVLYPAAVVPVGAPKLYPPTREPSENWFDLKNPAQREAKPPLPNPEKP
jgi:outer membrane protein TolC